MRRLTCYLTLSLTVGLAERVAAQSPAKCDSATALASGYPLPPAASHDWNAWRLVASCGASQGVGTLVAALASPQIVTETDPAKLNELFEIFDGRLDGTLFAAYTDAVSSSNGSDAFRIAAMRALGSMVEPNLDTWLPLAGSNNRGCTIGSRRLDRRARTASTLPADALARVIATVSAVATSDASARVKLTAGCWQEMLEFNVPIDPRKISISYVCGNNFRVTNANPNGVDLNYIVGNHMDSGEFGVRGRGQYELTVSIVSEASTVSIYLGKKMIGRQANGGTVCK